MPATLALTFQLTLSGVMIDMWLRNKTKWSVNLLLHYWINTVIQFNTRPCVLCFSPPPLPLPVTIDRYRRTHSPELTWWPLTLSVLALITMNAFACWCLHFYSLLYFNQSNIGRRVLQYEPCPAQGNRKNPVKGEFVLVTVAHKGSGPGIT